MRHVSDKLNEYHDLAISGAVLIGTAIIGPVISVFALSVLSVSFVHHRHQAKKLFEKRIYFQEDKNWPYGCKKTQDYRTWNGKALENDESINNVCPHKVGRVFNHCSKDRGFLRKNKDESPTSFDSQKDFNFLECNYRFKRMEKLRDRDKRLIKFFAKLMLPLGGVFWALFKTSIHDHNVCDLCVKNTMYQWTWHEALNHHRSIISTTYV